MLCYHLSGDGMESKIVCYNYSLRGKSHYAMGTCCQDSSKVVNLFSGCYLAVVADGVGSAKNSQIGSSIAVETVTDFFKRNIKHTLKIATAKLMFQLAYEEAMDNIVEKSKEMGEPIESFDTTLSSAVYLNGKIIYAHSGDGAIIGLDEYGNYREITSVQKGEDNVSVVPLRGGSDTWEIDYYREKLTSVLLMTDGMYDTICPSLLKNAKISNIYTPLGTFFGDPCGFKENEELQKEEIKDFMEFDKEYNVNRFYKRLAEIYSVHIPEDFKNVIEEQLQLHNYPLALMSQQEDDKTVAGIINCSAEVESKNLKFFCEPDWDDLREELRKKLYPSSSKDVKDETEKIEEVEEIEETVEKDIPQVTKVNEIKINEPVFADISSKEKNPVINTKVQDFQRDKNFIFDNQPVNTVKPAQNRYSVKGTQKSNTKLAMMLMVIILIGGFTAIIGGVVVFFNREKIKTVVSDFAESRDISLDIDVSVDAVLDKLGIQLNSDS